MNEPKCVYTINSDGGVQLILDHALTDTDIENFTSLYNKVMMERVNYDVIREATDIANSDTEGDNV